MNIAALLSLRPLSSLTAFGSSQNLSNLSERRRTLLFLRFWTLGIRAAVYCACMASAACSVARGQGSVQYIGNVSTVASGLSENIGGPAFGVAVDASGNVYVADTGNNRVLKETLSAGSYLQTVVADGTNGLNYPSGIAVDGAGNVYIANFTSGDVYKETPTTGGYSQTLVANSTANGLQTPQGVAVDGSGNVYIADGGNNRVLKETPSAGGYSQSVVTNSSDGPYAVAVDGSGSVYIAYFTSGTVVKETPSLGGYTQSLIANPANNGFLYVSGVAVDASGNVYIAAEPTNNVYKETLSAGSYTQSILPTGVEAYIGADSPCCGANASGIAVDTSGNVYTNGLGVVYKEAASAVNFGGVDVGSQSGVVYMYFGFPASDAASSVEVSNQSPLGLDFAQSGVSNANCGTGSYVSWFCYVPVTFMPQQLGRRSGVVTVTDNSTPATVVQAQIVGTGVAPQIGFLPSNQVVIASAPTNGPLFGPEGVAVDGIGNLYIADTSSGRVLKETLSAGSYSQSVIPYAGTINAAGPVGVAVDADGSVYIADPSNGVYRETLSAGNYTQAQISPALASGVAVDDNGNVYFAAGNTVYKETLNSGSYTLSTIGMDAVLDATGVAVDAAGNVYVTDNGGKRLLKWTLTRTTYGESTIASGLANPLGVAVDGNGDAYIADQGGEVYKETFSAGSYSQSTIGNSLVPYGVAVDGSGNVYIADLFDHKVYEVGSASAPTLNFSSTDVGSTSSDSPQTLTVENSGTGTLIFPAPSSGNNPSISANFTLGSRTTCPVLTVSSSPASLAPGATCVYSISFAPSIVGAVSGSLTLTDNSLNATSPYAVQTIALMGTGIGNTASVSLTPTSLTFASSTVGTTSAGQTLTLTNSGTAALTIVSIAASGDFAQTHTCGTSLAAGASCTISVTFTPSAAGTRTGMLTVTDNATGSPQTVALSGTGVATAPAAALSPSALTFGSQTTGTTSAALTVTLTNSGTAALSLTSVAASGDFAVSQSCGATIAAGGACTLSVTFMPTATGTRTGTVNVTDNATGSPQTVSLTGTGVAPVVTAPAVTLSPTSLTFAVETVGTASTAQTVTLTNSGTAALSLTSIAASGDFAVSQSCGTSITFSGTCTLSVTFTPTAAGTRTGTLTVTDNASDSPQTVTLSGGGEAVAVSTSSTALTISSAGGTATATIQISPQGGYTGTANMTCAVKYQGQGAPTDPPTCSLSPAQAQITGNTAVSTTLTVSTTAASASAAHDWKWKGSGAMLAALLFLGILPRRRWRGGVLLVILCLTLVGGMLACGGGSSGGGSTTPTNPGTTTGSYQVVVTATSGTVIASTTIPLTLQ